MLRAAAIGLALALAAGAAQAHDLFDRYQASCVKHRAERAPALREAEAAGFKPVPASMLQNAFSGLENVDARLLATSAGVLVLVVADQTRIISGERMKLRFCAVAQVPADPGEPLKKLVADYAGVATDARLTQGSTTAYVFTQEAGRHVAIRDPDDAEALGLIRSGRANFVLLVNEPQMTMLGFAVPTSAMSPR
jgi:hypothetical protein